MESLIDKKYLEEYREAYLEALKQIEKGNIKKHSMMFLNPDEKDIVQTFMDNRDRSKITITLCSIIWLLCSGWW